MPLHCFQFSQKHKTHDLAVGACFDPRGRLTDPHSDPQAFGHAISFSGLAFASVFGRKTLCALLDVAGAWGPPVRQMAIPRSLVGTVLRHLFFQKHGPCFFKNTDPVFSKTRTLFFEKHGPCFFKNMGPVFSKKWVQKLEKNGAASWGILEVHISRFSVAKTIAGRGLFCANFLGFLHIFGLRWWERRRSYFGKKSFHISAEKHSIFPQKVVSHFLKKALHISPKKHSIFPQKCTLYF